MFMLRQPPQATSSRDRGITPQDHMRRESEAGWRSLRLAGADGPDITPKACLDRLQQKDMQAARSPSQTRVQTNAAVIGAMNADRARRLALGEIDKGIGGDQPATLEDIGQTEKARAALLRTAANDLLPEGSRRAIDHNAMQNHKLVLRTAMRHEVRGIAALEGRDGLAARTGLEKEDLDKLVANSRAGDLLARHAQAHAPREDARSDAGPTSESAPEETPQEAWERKAKSLSPEDFNAEVSHARGAFIEKTLPASSTDRETRIERTTLLRVNREAEEAGVASGRSLKLNQGLMRYAPEGTDAREELAAIRSVCLAQRKRQREASDARE